MDQPIETAQILDKLKEIAKGGFDERIYVRGSKAVNYGRVAEVMSLITSAGYKKVALVTEQEKSESAKLRFSRSEPGVIVSLVAHIGLLIAAMTLFANTDKFEDAAEMIPIDVVSDSELNSVVKGERTAKEVKLGPRVDKVADKQDTPPEPPLNQAEKDKPAPPQQAQKLPEPSASSDPQKLSSLPSPEKTPETKPAEPKPAPAVKDKAANEEDKPEVEEAEVIKPKPPKRPKFEAETKISIHRRQNPRRVLKPMS